MNPVTSMWYGVDPLTEQYVNIGAYIYCYGNLIILFDPDGQGDYFAKNGQYLGRDKWDDNKVFLADGIVNGHFHNIKRLDVSQHRFKVMANIIAQEGSSKDPEDYTFIANIARNEANAQGRSMWSLLTSGYSSVPDTKTELSNKDNSQKANMARAALIGVVLGNPDPTNGLRFWDGSDFLAWGTGAYKDPKGIERVAHPKFFSYPCFTRFSR